MLQYVATRELRADNKADRQWAGFSGCKTNLISGITGLTPEDVEKYLKQTGIVTFMLTGSYQHAEHKVLESFKDKGVVPLFSYVGYDGVDAKQSPTLWMIPGEKIVKKDSVNPVVMTSTPDTWPLAPEKKVVKKAAKKVAKKVAKKPAKRVPRAQKE